MKQRSSEIIFFVYGQTNFDGWWHPALKHVVASDPEQPGGGHKEAHTGNDQAYKVLDLMSQSKVIFITYIPCPSTIWTPIYNIYDLTDH
jgi:hypothetical protein